MYSLSEIIFIKPDWKAVFFYCCKNELRRSVILRTRINGIPVIRDYLSNRYERVLRCL